MGFRGSAQLLHLHIHMQSSHSRSGLTSGGEISVGNERRTVLSSAGEEFGESLGVGAKWCVFLVFHILPTTVTAYIYASHCGVSYLNYFVCVKHPLPFSRYSILIEFYSASHGCVVVKVAGLDSTVARWEDVP